MDDYNNLFNRNETGLDPNSLNLFKDNSLDFFLNGRNCNFFQNYHQADNEDFFFCEKNQNDTMSNSKDSDMQVEGKEFLK
jgi:hypothetical protein